MKRRFVQALITSVVMSSLIITPILAAPSVDELKEDKKAAESEVSSLQNQLSDLLGKMSQLEEDLIAKGEEITQATEDLAEAEAQEKKQYEDMKLRIKFMYEDGNTSMIEALVTSDTFTDLVNKAEYVQNVHDYDRDQLEAYVKTKQEVAELKTTLEEEQKNMQSMQTEYEAQEDELNETITAKQDEVANLDEQIQEAAEAAAREAEARRQAEAAAAAANNSGGGSSGGGNSGGSSNSGSSGGYTKPSGGVSYNPSTGNAIVDAAYSQLGVPYVWGGTTPYVGLDCSGLTQYCYRMAGKSIPRTSSAQLAAGTKVSNPQPGDICWTPGHVAIYIGGGKMIEAQQDGVPVCISSVRATYYLRF